MGTIRDGFNNAWPDGPSSSPTKPDKAVIRTLGATIEDSVSGAAQGYVIAATWTALAATPGERSGQPGRVPSTATGTHTDPVVGGTVPNSGEFVWSVSPAGWRRVGDVIDPPAIAASLASEVSRATARENELEGMALGEHLLDEKYARAEVAADGVTVLVGYGYDGVVDVNDAYPLLDPEFVYVETYADGETILRGVRYDGSSFPGSSVSGGSTSDAAWVAGGEVIVLRDGLRAPISFFTPEGTTNANAYVDGNFAHYLQDDGVSVDQIKEYLLASTSLDPTVAKIVHFILYGQSLSYGAYSSPPIHTEPVRAGFGVMFNGGVQVNGAVSPAIATPPNNRDSLVDAAEILTLESPGVAIVYGVTGSAGLEEDEAALISGHGRGGQSYLTLKKNGNQGGQEWRNLVAASKRARVIAALNQVDYELGALHWIHGEQDRNASKATYKAWMLELRGDASTDLGAAVVVVLDQISNWTAYDMTSSQVPFAQLEVAVENPTTHVCVGPKYMLETVTDGIHLTAPSSARLGSYHARAVNRFRAGLNTLPLHCEGFTRSGSQIRLQMHVPVGPLAIDTTAVSNPGNYGITWNQTGGIARTISSIALDGSDIVVTLTGDPGAFTSAYIGIAATGVPGANGGPATGARSNFRDSAADLDIDGAVMPNWAAHQLIQIS